MSLKNFLFPSLPGRNMASALLLVVRIVTGLLFMSHGVAKWAAFESLALTFPDPLGVGGTISLLMIIFAEVICCVAYIVGFMYRLAMLPMIFAMGVALFVIHAGQPVADRELSLIYFVIFILMYIAGPGKISVDAVIRQFIGRR